MHSCRYANISHIAVACFTKWDESYIGLYLLLLSLNNIHWKPAKPAARNLTRHFNGCMIFHGVDIPQFIHLDWFLSELFILLIYFAYLLFFSIWNCSLHILNPLSFVLINSIYHSICLLNLFMITFILYFGIVRYNYLFFL